MRRFLDVIARFFRWVVPSRYEGRRDRLSAEADQLTSANQFRSGM